MLVSAGKDERNKAISAVQDAVKLWEGDGPMSINAFKVCAPALLFVTLPATLQTEPH